MHSNQGIVQKSECKKAYTYDIQHKTSVGPERDIFLGIGFEALRIGKVASGDHQQRKGNGGRDGECEKTETVTLESTSLSLEKHYHIEKQRTQNGTELIKQFLQAECLAGSLL